LLQACNNGDGLAWGRFRAALVDWSTVVDALRAAYRESLPAGAVPNRTMA
jgi:hypothetical protein